VRARDVTVEVEIQRHGTQEKRVLEAGRGGGEGSARRRKRSEDDDLFFPQGVSVIVTYRNRRQSEGDPAAAHQLTQNNYRESSVSLDSLQVSRHFGRSREVNSSAIVSL
jgi:hypothetical protein